MVTLGIATGLRARLRRAQAAGLDPARPPRLLGAKIVAIVVVELAAGGRAPPGRAGLGWNPGGGGAAVVAVALGAILLGSAAFAGIGLLMAGTLRAEVNLAAANGLYLVLLLLGGMIVPLAKLPAGLADFAKLLPAAALSTALHATLGTRQSGARRVVGRAGGLGRGRPGCGRAHLPLGMRARSSAVNDDGVSTRPGTTWLMVPSPLTNTV